MEIPTRRPDEDQYSYLNAARRQVEICRYHSRRLNEILDDRRLRPEAVDVDIQAYFDGAISVVVAAHDKATEALLVAAGLSHGVGDTDKRSERLKHALSLLSRELQEAIGDWRDDRWDDIHELRVRIVHHVTAKRPEDGLMQVNVIRPNGPVELREYTKMAIDLIEDLVPLLDRLEAELVEISSPVRSQVNSDR